MAAKTPLSTRGGSTSKLPRARYFKPIPVERIKTESQVRKTFPKDTITGLADSVRNIGMRQPPTVRPTGTGTTFTLITGERRVRAAREAGLESVDCLIIDGTMSEADILELQLAENLHREDLDQLEAAEGFHRLMRLRGWNQSQLAQHLHLSNGYVSKILALRTLTPAVKEQVASGALSPGTGYQLSKVVDPKQQQSLAQEIVTKKIPRDSAVALIQKKTNPPANTKKGKTEAAKVPCTPKTTQLELETGPNTTVSVRSDQDLALSEICQALRQALTHSLKYRRTPWKSPEKLSMGMLAEILHALDGENKALAPDFEELLELIHLLLAQELSAIFALRDGRSDAALRAYNRLNDKTKASLGPISSKGSRK